LEINGFDELEGRIAPTGILEAFGNPSFADSWDFNDLREN